MSRFGDVDPLETKRRREERREAMLGAIQRGLASGDDLRWAAARTLARLMIGEGGVLPRDVAALVGKVA